MITRIHIENFKSLVDFDLPPRGNDLAGFTCLIGMNGAGKTTLLQAFDFVAHLASGKLEEWLARRDWDKMDLVSNLGGKKSMVILLTVRMTLSNGHVAEWRARYHAPSLRCTQESIIVEGDSAAQAQVLLHLHDTKLKVLNPLGEEHTTYDKIPFEYQGSVLSTLNLSDFHSHLREVKAQLQGLHSLELLAPQLMRRRSRESDDIGPGGERLAGFLSNLTDPQQSDLLTQIQSFYPEIVHWRVKRKQYGWKGLLVGERTMGGTEVGEAHINDGFLRVIAMLSQAYTNAGMLLLDEIENGMNPAMVGKLMDFLVALGHKGQQVIVTTHSPVILNYLDDEVAKEGVMLLYKTADGCTRACRYFDEPETRDKLRALGPGEVFADTDLRKMVARLAAITPEPETEHTNGK